MDWITPRVLQSVSRIAAVATLTGLGLTVCTTAKVFGVVLAAIATTLLWLTREVGHQRNARLREQVERLGGSLGALGTTVEQNKPALNIAAAIAGQGEMATWSYTKIVAQLKLDGYIS